MSDKIELVNIGFGNMVAADKILAIMSSDSAPVKRIVQEAKERKILVDATFGRKTEAVIITTSDTVIISSLSTDKIAAKLAKEG